MMYMKIETGTWDDSWSDGLMIDERLASIYLMSNACCRSGEICQISIGRAEIDTGLNDIKAVLALERVRDGLQEN